jgi:hypothetical protein
MTSDDIKQIERLLGMTLPEELVEKYTSNILEGIEEFPELKGFFILEPKVLIQVNQRLRRKGLWKKPFPEHLFVIGRAGNEYYLIDLREKPLRVFRVMNNKTWAYDPSDLEDNLVCSVPEQEGLSTFIKILPLSFLHMKREEKMRGELGVPGCELTGDEMNKMLDEMADGTFDEKNWPQIYDEIHYKARE